MADQTEGRVAVYIDFDNIVISRYDELNGNGSWRRDNARSVLPAKKSDDPVATKLWQAEIDVSAILDYASSFGVVALSRAYADWSVPVNASYRKQLVNRAVDLTQLFPVTKALQERGRHPTVGRRARGPVPAARPHPRRDRRRRLRLHRARAAVQATRPLCTRDRRRGAHQHGPRLRVRPLRDVRRHPRCGGPGAGQHRDRRGRRGDRRGPEVDRTTVPRRIAVDRCRRRDGHASRRRRDLPKRDRVRRGSRRPVGAVASSAVRRRHRTHRIPRRDHVRKGGHPPAASRTRAAAREGRRGVEAGCRGEDRRSAASIPRSASARWATAPSRTSSPRARASSRSRRRAPTGSSDSADRHVGTIRPTAASLETDSTCRDRYAHVTRRNGCETGLPIRGNPVLAG